MAFFASLAPKADFSFADVVDELRSTREANKALIQEKDLLQAQVNMLSQQRLGDQTAILQNAAGQPVTGQCDGRCVSVDASTSTADDSMVDELPTSSIGSCKNPRSELFDSFQAMRTDLAANLGADKQLSGYTQQRALMDQLADARTKVDAANASRDVCKECLRCEMEELEAQYAETVAEYQLRCQQLILQCDELELALHAQTQREQQLQQSAMAAAKQQSAARIASLEEMISRLQEEAARHDNMMDDFDSEPQLQLELKAQAAMEACKMKTTELQKAQAELATIEELHAAELRAARQGAKRLEAAVAAAAQQAADGQEALRRVQADAERAGELHRRQGEELLALRAQLARLEAAQAGMIEKKAARAWVVNFVENGDRREEMLQLMASWWGFEEEDLIRVGLSAEPPPKQDRRERSLSDAFASFLDLESEPEKSSITSAAIGIL